MYERLVTAAYTATEEARQSMLLAHNLVLRRLTLQNEYSDWVCMKRFSRASMHSYGSGSSAPRRPT
jgi:hypothetical protein